MIPIKVICVQNGSTLSFYIIFYSSSNAIFWFMKSINSIYCYVVYAHSIHSITFRIDNPFDCFGSITFSNSSCCWNSIYSLLLLLLFTAKCYSFQWTSIRMIDRNCAVEFCQCFWIRFVRWHFILFSYEKMCASIKKIHLPQPLSPSFWKCSSLFPYFKLLNLYADNPFRFIYFFSL